MPGFAPGLGRCVVSWSYSGRRRGCRDVAGVRTVVKPGNNISLSFHRCFSVPLEKRCKKHRAAFGGRCGWGGFCRSVRARRSLVGARGAVQARPHQRGDDMKHGPSSPPPKKNPKKHLFALNVRVALTCMRSTKKRGETKGCKGAHLPPAPHHTPRSAADQTRTRDLLLPYLAH